MFNEPNCCPQWPHSGSSITPVSFNLLFYLSSRRDAMNDGDPVTTTRQIGAGHFCLSVPLPFILLSRVRRGINVPLLRLCSVHGPQPRKVCARNVLVGSNPVFDMGK